MMQRSPFAWVGRVGPTPVGQPAPAGTRRCHPDQQSADTRSAENPGTGSPNQPPGTREIDSKKGYRALDGRGTRALALVDQFRFQEPVDLLCSIFESLDPATTRTAAEIDFLTLNGCFCAAAWTSYSRKAEALQVAAASC